VVFDTAMNLEPLLPDAYPILLDTTVGTRDAAELERALDALPLGAPIRRCFHFSVSVGAVFGVELVDGRRVAVKAHQPSTNAGELAAVQRAQAHFAANGIPCPRPMLAPTPFLETLATAEAWLEDGEIGTEVTQSRRRAMAELLARLISLGAELLPMPPLEYGRYDDAEPWPRPHNALFDFAATRAGADDIDAIARRAAPRMRAGPVVLAHQDWSVKQFRFLGDEITAVYDWDSLSVEHESVAVGGAAATHTAEFSHPWLPRLEDALAFVEDYERARAWPFTDAEREAVRARIAYNVAYTARCEHALAACGHTTFVTRAREALPEFAAELLP
jgi:Ser/Thr protein kinase RdoA (MazF antagonist)